MMAARSITIGNVGVSAGAWRWAALCFIFLAIAAAAIAVSTPDAARWAGLMLLAGIGALASIFLYAVWPRDSINTSEARRVAEAAARANVAWAITSADGAVLECNNVYRRMSGAEDGEAAPPPELALLGKPSSAVLYRLTRGATEGVAREESFQVAPGLEIVGAVRPLSDRQTVWWFTPRLAASAAAQTSLPDTRPADLAIGELFRDAPVGMAFVMPDGKLSDANRAFADFFGVQTPLKGRGLIDLVEPSDRAAVGELIAKAAGGSIELRAAGAEERAAELFSQPTKDGRTTLYLL